MLRYFIIHVQQCYLLFQLPCNSFI